MKWTCAQDAPRVGFDGHWHGMLEPTPTTMDMNFCDGAGSEYYLMSTATLFPVLGIEPVCPASSNHKSNANNCAFLSRPQLIFVLHVFWANTHQIKMSSKKYFFAKPNAEVCSFFRYLLPNASFCQFFATSKNTFFVFLSVFSSNVPSMLSRSDQIPPQKWSSGGNGRGKSFLHLLLWNLGKWQIFLTISSGQMVILLFLVSFLYQMVDGFGNCGYSHPGQ